MKTLFSGLSMRAEIVRVAVGLSVATICFYALAGGAAHADSSASTPNYVTDTEEDDPTMTCHEEWVAYWDCVFIDEDDNCDAPDCSAISPEGIANAFFEAYIGI